MHHFWFSHRSRTPLMPRLLSVAAVQNAVDRGNGECLSQKLPCTRKLSEESTMKSHLND